jgi:hypothetical protein
LTTIRDGTANTIAIGESKQRHLSGEYGPYWGSGLHTAVGGRTTLANTPNPFAANANCFKPNYSYAFDVACQNPVSTAQNLRPLQYAWGFGSWHPQVTNFVMCDGAVKTLQDNISPAAWIAYGTMEGGEAMANPQN